MNTFFTTPVATLDSGLRGKNFNRAVEEARDWAAKNDAIGVVYERPATGEFFASEVVPPLVRQYTLVYGDGRTRAIHEGA